MKFEDVYGRWQGRRLSQAEAAEILGMSERTFRRWRDRYEGEGATGLLDRRLGKASARRVPTDQVDAVLSLYRERYDGFTVRHFHDKLCRHHGFTLGYTWTKLRLQEAGLIARAPRPRRRVLSRGPRAAAAVAGSMPDGRSWGRPVSPLRRAISSLSAAFSSRTACSCITRSLTNPRSSSAESCPKSGRVDLLAMPRLQHNPPPRGSGNRPRRPRFCPGYVILAPDAERVRRFFTVVLLLGMWIAVEATITYTELPWGRTIEEVGGGYLGLGRVCGIAALVALVAGLFEDKRSLRSVVLVVLFLFLMFALLIGGGRGPFVATCAGIAVLVILGWRVSCYGVAYRRYQPWLLAMGVLIVLGIAYLAATSETATLRRLEVLFTNAEYGRSASERLLFYDKAIYSWGQAPTFGHGLGSWPILLDVWHGRARLPSQSHPGGDGRTWAGRARRSPRAVHGGIPLREPGPAAPGAAAPQGPDPVRQYVRERDDHR